MGVSARGALLPPRGSPPTPSTSPSEGPLRPEPLRRSSCVRSVAIILVEVSKGGVRSGGAARCDTPEPNAPERAVGASEPRSGARIFYFCFELRAVAAEARVAMSSAAMSSEGARLNGYTTLEKLGKGGFGTTYAVHKNKERRKRKKK